MVTAAEKRRAARARAEIVRRETIAAVNRLGVFLGAVSGGIGGMGEQLLTDRATNAADGLTAALYVGRTARQFLEGVNERVAVIEALARAVVEQKARA